VRKTLYGLLLTWVLLTRGAYGQAAAPGWNPARERLGYFAGNWVFTGTIGKLSFGPAGPRTHSELCVLLGDFFVVCLYEINSTESLRGVGIVGYDGTSNRYKFTSYDSSGITSNGTAVVEGDTWNWAFGSRSRTMWKMVSGTAYTITVENLGPNGQWVATMQGRYDKSGR
jgi:hypothetical protein